MTVRFATPFTDWRVMFDHMVPAHIARRVGWNHGFDTFDPSIDLSAGPFIVQSMSTERAVLVRNPRWWGAPAALDRVVVDVAPGPTGWAGALATGNRTAVQPVSFDLGAVGLVTSMPNTDSSIKPSLGMVDLEFDMTAPTTSRLAARQAIAHALDRTDLLQRTFGPIDPDLVVNQDHLAVPSQQAYTPSPAAGAYESRDLDATTRLLRGLGYHQDAAGKYLDASGDPLTLQMAVENGEPWTGEVGAIVASQLRSAGFTVDTLPVDGPAGLTRAAAGGRLRHRRGLAPVQPVPDDHGQLVLGHRRGDRHRRVRGLEQLRRSLGRPALHRSVPSPQPDDRRRSSTGRSTTSCGPRWSVCRCSASRD